MMSRGILRMSLAVLLCLVAIPLLVGCGDKTVVAPPVVNPPPSTVGTISGTASLPMGTPGDIRNTMVSIYANYDDWNGYRPTRSVQSSGDSPSQISFTFTNVTPGTYYLDCWKDNDLSRRWSVGDFLGVYGSTVWPGMTPAPLSVAAGQPTIVQVIVIGI